MSPLPLGHVQTIRESYPPRWRFGFVRDVVKLVDGAGRISARRRRELVADALEHLDALEATLLPTIPSVAEFRVASLLEPDTPKEQT